MFIIIIQIWHVAAKIRFEIMVFLCVVGVGVVDLMQSTHEKCTYFEFLSNQLINKCPYKLHPNELKLRIK